MKALIHFVVPVVMLISGVAFGESANKVRTGWDFAGLPLINFTSDRGMGYGAYVASYYHGPSGAGENPYRASIAGQFYQTTGGYAFHKFLVDFPNLLDSGLRLELLMGYEAWDSAWYFGRGDSTPRLLPEETPENFYEYDIKSFWVVPALRVPLSNSWSLFMGGAFRLVASEVYDQSRLEQDAPRGVEGGSLSQLSFGVLYDSRDTEPTPLSGIFSEVSLRGAHELLGSDYALRGVNITHRQWVSLLEGGRLVLAFRLGADAQKGQTVFYHEHVLGGSQWVEVGGNLVLRGLPSGRYRGHWTMYSNLELRLHAFEFDLWGADFDVLLVPFLDTAKVGLWRVPNDWDQWHFTVGGGPRLVYNDVFVVRFDLGWGKEEYTSSGSPTGKTVTETGWVRGIYAIVNHPF